MRGVQRVLFNSLLIRYPRRNESDERPSQMRITLSLALCAVLAVSGCARISDSRLNPLNWFGQSTSGQVTNAGELRPLVPENRATKIVDGRGLVQSVSSLFVERTPSGAIVRATGIVTGANPFNAQLVPVSLENGVYTFEFRVEASQAAGGRQSITAARALTMADLAGVRTIRIQSATNQRSSKR